MDLLEKLRALFQRWEEIGRQINDPDSMNDMKLYIRLNKDYKDLQPYVDAFRQYTTILQHIESARDVLYNEKDDELKDFAKEELTSLNAAKDKLEEDVRLMLIPADPQDDKNAVVEIRAGTGGDEASLFAGDLYRMITRYCETKGWKVEMISYSEGTMGGFKEVIFEVKGDKVYGQLKYESGVHRVQRIPTTETQGRIHTSAASIAVLPEADEFDVDIKPSDIRKETFCASGPGGQSVNTTYSAIRLTHAPTGISVSCQDQKSQLKNYEQALTVLRTRIFELEYKKYLDEIAGRRKTMVSTGDRSAKIRTYNYPQGRVTDHRINMSLHNLPGIMDGAIQDLIDALQMAENAERLKEAVNA